MYQRKYFNSINESLKKSRYSIKQKPIDIETFFTKINSLLHSIQKSNNIIFNLNVEAIFSAHPKSFTNKEKIYNRFLLIEDYKNESYYE